MDEYNKKLWDEFCAYVEWLGNTEIRQSADKLTYEIWKKIAVFPHSNLENPNAFDLNKEELRKIESKLV